MIVRTHMSPHPITLRTDTDYKTALRLMHEHTIRHLPVLDDNDRLAGIVAERDLLLAAMRYSDSAVEVGELMHRQVVTVRANAPITHAASLLVRHAVAGLPVVDTEDHVLGIITETDLFRALVTVLESKTARPGDAAVAAFDEAPPASAPRSSGSKSGDGKRAKPAARATGASPKPERKRA